MGHNDLEAARRHHAALKRLIERHTGDAADLRARPAVQPRAQPHEPLMAGKSVKNKRKYKALKRKGMPKGRAARIANAGKSASRKGGRKGGRKKK